MLCSESAGGAQTLRPGTFGKLRTAFPGSRSESCEFSGLSDRENASSGNGEFSKSSVREIGNFLDGKFAKSRVVSMKFVECNGEGC